MAYGRRDGFSFADGVPLKLSDRLQPPPPIIFYSVNVNAPNLLENEYDFSVEHHALKQYEKHKMAKEAQEKAKVDKVAQEIEQFAQNPLDTGQDPSKTETTIAKCVIPPSKDNSNKTNSKTTNFTGWPRTTTTILNPQPLVKDKVKTTEEISPKKQFNLADFESQSSSPFDMMELQTLNDLEELNTVFQGMAVTSPTKSCDLESVDQVTNPKDMCRPPNGYQIPYDARLYPSYVPNQNRHSLQNGHVNYEESAASGYTVPPPPKDWEEAQFPRLKSSKSTPDIRDEVIQERIWNRSQTPPPYSQPPVQNTAPQDQSFGLPTWQASRGSRSSSICLPPLVARSRPAPVPVNVSPGKTNIVESLPNPYQELDENQQQFSATVAQMGFRLDRVARTVKHLGMDEKKVVDHLCHVQNLEESGYEGNDAETALHLYDYNVQEAKRFLDLLKHFQDLGFQKNAARIALIRFKNDRDRALDSLLLS